MGIAAGNPEIPIRINLIAPPVYVMTCSTPDKADGLAVLTDGCKAVEEKIVGSGGNFVMQMAPKVVTATDEDELAARIRKLRKKMPRWTVTRTTRIKWVWAATRMLAAAARMTRMIRRKALGRRKGATRSERRKFSSTVILFCLHTHPCYSADFHLWLQYCLPIQSLSVVKTRPSMMKYH